MGGRRARRLWSGSVIGLLLLLGVLGGCAGNDAEEKPAPQVIATGPYFRIETELGEFSVALDTLQAPLSSARFADLAARGVYDGAPFSRRVPGEFVVLGRLDGVGLEGDSLQLETETGVHSVGTLGMVREEDPEARPGVAERPAFLRSARGEFFVCLGRETQLDGKYAAFAKVAAGLPVVRALANVKKDAPDPRILRAVPIDTPATDGPQ